MHPERAGAPSGIYVALAYCLPLVVWLAAQSALISDQQADPRRSFELLLRALILLQAAAVTLSLPWFLRAPSRPAQVSALFMAVLVPLPLYTLCWLVGAANAASLLQALLTLCGLSALLYCLYATAIALAPAGRIRSVTLLGLQIAILGCLWSYREQWLAMASL
jgi:hypothetical protein